MKNKKPVIFLSLVLLVTMITGAVGARNSNEKPKQLPYAYCDAQVALTSADMEKDFVAVLASSPYVVLKKVEQADGNQFYSEWTGLSQLIIQNPKNPEKVYELDFYFKIIKGFKGISTSNFNPGNEKGTVRAILRDQKTGEVLVMTSGSTDQVESDFMYKMITAGEKGLIIGRANSPKIATALLNIKDDKVQELFQKQGYNSALNYALSQEKIPYFTVESMDIVCGMRFRWVPFAASTTPSVSYTEISKSLRSSSSPKTNNNKD